MQERFVGEESVTEYIKRTERELNNNELFINYKKADCLEASIFAFESLMGISISSSRELDTSYQRIHSFLEEEGEIAGKLIGMKRSLEIIEEILSSRFKAAIRNKENADYDFRDIKSTVALLEEKINITYEVIDNKVLRLQNAVSSLVSTYIDNLSKLDSRIYNR